MCTNTLSSGLHEVKHVWLTGGFLEGEGFVICLYFISHEVSEVGGIFWIGPGYFFMVDQLVKKLLFLEECNC